MADTSGARRVAVPIGTVFRGDWEVVGHLADGGSSSVYRARFVGEFRRHDFPDEVALKITVPLAPEERTARVREYDTAVRFRSHPTIVTAYEAFAAELEVGRCVVFVHELCGESLSQRLRRSALDRGEVRRLADDLAGALSSLHAEGVVHSDVKPANILRVGDRWKLGDLGAAAVGHTSTSTSAAFIGGTLPYSPPEQASELLGASTPTVTRRDADIWAFGVVIHEAATGQRPFADAVRQVDGVIQIDPSLPAELDPVVRGCLQRDRSQRYPDGAAVARALQFLPPIAATVSLTPSGVDVAIDPAAVIPAASPAVGDASSPIASPVKSIAAVQQGPEPHVAPLPASADAGRSRRRLLVGAGAAGMLTLGAIAFGQWGSDGDVGSAASNPDATSIASPDSTAIASSAVATTGQSAATSPPASAGQAPTVSVERHAFAGTDGWSDAECALPIVTSTEKQLLMEEIVGRFNAAAAIAGSCVRATSHAITSGDATALLVADWPVDRSGAPLPVIWSPASRAWGELAAHRRGRPVAIDNQAASLMRSPVVIAMPRSTVDRLGIVPGQFGFKELRDLAAGDPNFALVRTYPQSSTAAVSGLIDQYYALGGASSTPEARLAFNEALESANTRYRDNTLDVLEDVASGELALDAIVLETKSVADYNRSDPRGTLPPGTISPLPADPLVPLYPTDGTVVSDHPLYVVDDPWVLPNQRVAAEDFISFATSLDTGQRVVEWGFEPPSGGTPMEVAEHAVPDGATIEMLQREWSESRTPLRLELLVDLSGSMLTDDRIGFAKQALLELIDGDLLSSRDEIGLRVFTTGLRGEKSIIQDLITPAPFGEIAAELRQAVEGLRVVPNGDTPLYRALELTVADETLASADGARVGAIVVLSDGENDDPSGVPDRRGHDDRVRLLAGFTADDNLVRVFTIAYGTDADATVLSEIASASGARSYDARDVTKIASVLRQAVSNT